MKLVKIDRSIECIQSNNMLSRSIKNHPTQPIITNPRRTIMDTNDPEIERLRKENLQLREKLSDLEQKISMPKGMDHLNDQQLTLISTVISSMSMMRW